MRKRIKGNPFYIKIYNRTYEKRKNTLLLIQGEPGTGKSVCGIRVGYDNDPKFKSITEEEIDDFLRERIIRSPKQFIDLINSTTLKKGSWVMFDEAGVGISHKEWWSFQNRAIGKILQVFRNRRLIVVFTTPKISLLDKSSRDLMNFEIRAESIDFNLHLTRTKLLELSYHYHFQEMSSKFISMRNKNDGKMYEYPHYTFRKPPQFIVDAYERYADEFKKDIVAELAREAELIDKKEQSSKPDVEDDIMKQIDENIEDYVTMFHSKPTIKTATLMSKHDITETLARKLRARCYEKFEDRIEKFAIPPQEN